ncbi:hypothetical protein [Flavobacterium sp. CSZ]|uniref:hypothetical protein n=1 Tax=Flavobacterium sp. CSZ TaxID=2783791 RepID=UPI00188A1845|nr:hypothetical protein [Flavobacterium sp. CSZ]MBF4487717.1 hypothetical protein [Flavobacterium sp. CSZ]
MAKLTNKLKNFSQSPRCCYVCYEHNKQGDWGTEELAKEQMKRHLKKMPQPHDATIIYEQTTTKSYQYDGINLIEVKK